MLDWNGAVTAKIIDDPTRREWHRLCEEEGEALRNAHESLERGVVLKKERLI
jgi:hypothetical protein